MNAKTSLLGLCGMLLVGLSACVGGTADMILENESQVMEFRRKIDELKMQVKTKDEETKRLAQELEKAKKLEAQELEKAKKVEAQVLALEERLRLMDDLVMTKSEQIASLESQLAGAKEAAEAAAAAAAAAVVETMTKRAPAKKAKPGAGTQSQQAP